MVINLEGNDTVTNKMCMKNTRSRGSLVCAYVSQEVLENFEPFMRSYSIGFNCICTGMWSWATRQGYQLPIKGEATHNCAKKNLSSTNWNLLELITDLGAGKMSDACGK